MEQIIFQDIKKDAVFYGVYYSALDMWNGSDVLCLGRKRFFETGASQKKRSTIKTDNGTYNYNYKIENGSPLKYKKVKNSQQAEKTVEFSGGYYVELSDESHKTVKRAYYDLFHIWQRTEYFSPSDKSVILLITPDYNSEDGAVICKTSESTERLIPFNVSLDKEITQKLNIITSEPKIYCVTSEGSFYYCTAEEYDKRKQALEKLMSPQKEKTEEPVQGDASFVVNTKRLDEAENIGFDLKNSIEINVASASEAEKPSEPAEALQNEAPAKTEVPVPAVTKELESEPEAETKVSTFTAEKADISAENENNKSAEPAEEKVAEDKTKDNEKPAENASDNTSEKTEEKAVSALSEEAAEPAEMSIFNYEKGDIPPRHDRICSFAHECPYETVDKQVIESGGRQYYYFGELENGMRNGRGRTVMKNGETAYEGRYQDDKRDGFGVYYYKSGKLCYVGGWKNNQRDGFGAAFSPSDGNVIAGEWSSDESVGVVSHFDGKGKLLYSGNTKNGRRDGAGMTYNEATKTFFVGKYRDGIFLETGTQFSQDGDLLYTGGCKNGTRYGMGTSYRADGSIEYVGLWKNDLFDGEGTLYHRDGGKLSGSFRSGKACGKCTLTDSSGKIIYIGSFVDDEYNGTGRLFREDGGFAEGRFVDGEPTGIFNEYDKDKKLIYCGEWTDMHRNGKGIEYHDGEKKYEGEFKNSLYSGSGKLYHNGEAVYIGSFSNGKRNGFGVEFVENEINYKGMWKDDRYEGCGILYHDREAKFVGIFEGGRMNGRVNEISDRSIIRQSIYTNGELTYTCQYSPDGSLEYYGNMSGNMKNGMGCSFIACGEKQFEGIFRNDMPDKPMKVLLKDLAELPVCSELENTEYELYRKMAEYIIEKSITVGNTTGIYTGRLKSGLPNGNGTILYSDHRYTGYFFDGRPEGEGMVYLRSGEEKKGMFSAKPFAGCQTMVLADITYYYTEIR